MKFHLVKFHWGSLACSKICQWPNPSSNGLFKSFYYGVSLKMHRQGPLQVHTRTHKISFKTCKLACTYANPLIVSISFAITYTRTHSYQNAYPALVSGEEQQGVEECVWECNEPPPSWENSKVWVCVCVWRQEATDTGLKVCDTVQLSTSLHTFSKYTPTSLLL